MALLAWIESRKVFLKVQQGTGDNLSPEDLAAGFSDYVLWSTFRPACLDLDQTMDMELVDSGMVMSQTRVSSENAVEDCCRQAFGAPLPDGDASVLLTEPE